MRPNSKILIIAGSDSSGGAGIQADIKTVTALGSYALTAITAVTSQNTTGVKSIVGINPKEIFNQIIYSPKCIKAISDVNKLIKNKGRVLVRKSGTEPKIRIMCESKDSNLNKFCINIIKKSIR